MRRAPLLSALLLIANGPSAPVTGAPIEVDISGVRTAQGMVRVMICPRELFLGNCPWSGSAPARIGQVTVIVADVPPGRYAVQAFHDADNDGKLRRNWLGMPREGIGFSNDAMAHMTYPRFSVAGFDHGAVPQRIAIIVRYFID